MCVYTHYGQGCEYAGGVSFNTWPGAEHLPARKHPALLGSDNFAAWHRHGSDLPTMLNRTYRQPDCLAKAYLHNEGRLRQAGVSPTHVGSTQPYSLPFARVRYELTLVGPTR